MSMLLFRIIFLSTSVQEQMSQGKKQQITRIGSNSTWLDSTRHVRLCRASRDERVERDEPCFSNMADHERSCTSLVVFMLLHTQILFVSSNKIN